MSTKTDISALGSQVLLVGGVSRSGTTLLCAMLDASEHVSFGSELVCPSDGNLRGGNPSGILSALSTDARLGRLARRSGLNDEDVLSAKAFLGDSESRKESSDPVFEANVALLQARAVREASEIFGFKWNRGGAQRIFENYPKTKFLVIARHPSDVVASQLSRGFRRAPADIVEAWTKVYRTYLRMSEANESRVSIIRYEDLVLSPELYLRAAVERLGLRFDPAMLEHHTSSSALLKSDHVNAKQIRQPVLEPISRAPKQPLSSLGSLLHRNAHQVMEDLGYSDGSVLPRPARRSCADRPVPLPLKTIAEKRNALERKRKYTREDYANLVRELTRDNTVLTLRQYVHTGHPEGAGILLIRHDIDHDIENAVRIARWEHSQEIQSTFCVLHTAWYYGTFSGTSYRHSTLMLESLAEIQALGHEINLHNNFVTIGLEFGADPYNLLAEELGWLRSEGIHVVGTSTHGDRRCKELGYRNFELFSESVGTKFGGPRRVTDPATGLSVDLGRASYADFGLKYEAYDFHRDRYITDSGGTLREHEKANGRRNFGRQEQDGSLTALLTHPIWWGGF